MLFFFLQRKENAFNQFQEKSKHVDSTFLVKFAEEQACFFAETPDKMWRPDQDHHDWVVAPGSNEDKSNQNRWFVGVQDGESNLNLVHTFAAPMLWVFGKKFPFKYGICWLTVKFVVGSSLKSVSCSFLLSTPWHRIRNRIRKSEMFL